MLCCSLHRGRPQAYRRSAKLVVVAGVEGFKALCGFSADGVCCTATCVPVCIKTTNGHNQLAWEEYVKGVLKILKFTKACYATFKE